MFFDRYDIYIHAFLDFMNGKIYPFPIIIFTKLFYGELGKRILCKNGNEDIWMQPSNSRFSIF